MKRGAKVTIAGGTIISGVVGLAMMLQTIVAGWEGKTNVAVLPLPDDVPTICYGKTKGVKLGDKATDVECIRFLREELDIALAVVDSSIKVKISDEERAAYASLVYNVGATAFSKSTLVKRVNRHDRRGGCDELLRWNKFKGKPLNGLTRRREAERLLCLQGVN